MDKLQELKDRLQKLEDALPQSDTLSLVQKLIGEKYDEVTTNLKSDTTLQAIDSINSKLDQFKQDFNLEPIISAVEEINSTITDVRSSVKTDFENSSKTSDLTKQELTNLITSSKDELQGMTGKEISGLLEKITALEGQLNFQDDSTKKQGETVKSVIAGIESKLGSLSSQYKAYTSQYSTSSQEVADKFIASQKTVDSLTTALEQLRKDISKRFASIGGGSINRQMFIGGVDPLTRYTDMNLKAGSNVTITYANNNTTKQVDVTIASSGGGASVGGVIRSIATTTVSSTVGSVVGTDYVVLANGGLAVTLPTAVGNTNLYTIKNVGSSSVLVATTSAQTIDGQSTIIMPVQYTSIDLISDSQNWDIT